MRVFLIRLLLPLVFLLAFNGSFFFLCGTDNLMSVWISFGFINLSYLTLLVLPLFRTKGESAHYLAYTLYSQGFTYVIIEFIVGLIFIIWQLESPTWPLIIQALLWVIFMVVILANAWANLSTASSLSVRKQTIQKYQDWRMKLKRLMVMTENAELKGAILQCYDDLTITSSNETVESAEVDTEIESVIASLREAVLSGGDVVALSLTTRLRSLIKERNAILKYTNY